MVAVVVVDLDGDGNVDMDARDDNPERGRPRHLARQRSTCSAHRGECAFRRSFVNRSDDVHVAVAVNDHDHDDDHANSGSR